MRVIIKRTQKKNNGRWQWTKWVVVGSEAWIVDNDFDLLDALEREDYMNQGVEIEADGSLFPEGKLVIGLDPGCRPIGQNNGCYVSEVQIRYDSESDKRGYKWRFYTDSDFHNPSPSWNPPKFFKGFTALHECIRDLFEYCRKNAIAASKILYVRVE